MQAPSRGSEPGPTGALPSPGLDRIDPGQALAALRERGAQHADPVRFRFIEALERRAASHEGAVRQVLQDKLARALADYVAQLDRPAVHTGNGLHGPAPAAAGPLAELVRQLDKRLPQNGDERPALRELRSTWSKLRIHRQLSQSLAKLPANAGPLNSHRLVLRSLQVMREISPAYLNRFMAHVDALLWLDQGGQAGPPAQAGAAPGEGDRKRRAARGRPG